MDVNYLAVGVAVVAAFVVSGAWYALLGNQLATVSEAYTDAARRPAGWTVLVELIRNLVLAAVLAGLTARLGVDGWAGAVLLALVLWVGFPLVLWTGAVFHERTPVKLAAIHGADWLLKLLVVAVIVGVWR